ncbi:MAG TPA: sporulation membrane protein YtaF [Virgibacillus sp.]|nr:sporulation membrane protein YtaF [Virgibacillus sp.]
MLFYTGLLFLVIAVSLDGFGVGMTYGMRKIHVPLAALAIIMLCSGCVVLLSMTIGHLLSSFISPHVTTQLGGFILLILGCFALYNIRRSKTAPNSTNNNQKKKPTFKTILSTPDRADLDKSGIITINEALLLGIALALDAFGAGLGASMLGYSPLLTTISIALMSGLFVYGGIKTGMLLLKNKFMQKMTFVPPLLLITLGLINIFG